MLAAILGVLGLGGEVIKAKAELKRTRIEAETKAVMNAADNDATWEKMAGQNAASSYLDEFWTAILVIPLVLAFTGRGDVVDAGFEALQDVPDWYVWSVLASVGWAFARRGIPGVGAWLRKR